MNSRMRFIYFGSFHLSADILELLVAGGFMPSAVVCSPDRPAGRKQIITAPAIKQLILEKGWDIKILQPEKLEIENLKLKIGEVDLAIVMGYPKIIPQEIIDMPRLGTIGVHPSLLPKYRGASPIQTAILHGEIETGVTLYQMDAKMDHGQIIANIKLQIANEETNAGLEKKLAGVAAELLIETLPKFIAREITPHEQDHSQATFTKKFTTAEGEVDMDKTTYNKKLETENEDRKVYNMIRAFNPEPSVWTMNFPGYEGKRVKLLEAQIANGKLQIVKILPEGKKPLRI